MFCMLIHRRVNPPAVFKKNTVRSVPFAPVLFLPNVQPVITVTRGMFILQGLFYAYTCHNYFFSICIQMVACHTQYLHHASFM